VEGGGGHGPSTTSTSSRFYVLRLCRFQYVAFLRSAFLAGSLVCSVRGVCVCLDVAAARRRRLAVFVTIALMFTPCRCVLCSVCHPLFFYLSLHLHLLNFFSLPLAAFILCPEFAQLVPGAHHSALPVSCCYNALLCPIRVFHLPRHTGDSRV